ncbi:MAG: aminotransferase class V-fold PLP-dependent enzyme [Deltaproteobacteria bacterium]|jgi:selenocysteine lyase/cysteine desulfurase|nr:aminotransferase class V-fold PLP-dependent enzyme [Deltaproteobacteria bacterium]
MTVIYMNNAATAWPKAPGTAEAVAEKIDVVSVHPGRGGFEAEDPESDCRQLLANLMAVNDPARIILTSNATDALNIALQGFRFNPEDLVLTTVAEHNSVLRPLHYMKKLKNIKVAYVEVDRSGRVKPDKWAKALKRYKPQLAVFTHASNVTGSVNPVEEMAGLAKEVGAAVLLDASQTLGLIEVLPRKWSVDMVAFTGHKYLLGPPGTGGLYIGPEVDLEPVLVGGTGILSELEEMPPALPFRYEAGTPNTPSFAGLAHALSWQRENPAPIKEILDRAGRLASGLSALRAQVTSWNGQHTPVVSFTLPGWPTEDIGEMLQMSFNVVCRTGLHCAPLVHKYLSDEAGGTIRFSLSRFNTDTEVDYVISSIGRIIG